MAGLGTMGNEERLKSAIAKVKPKRWRRKAWEDIAAKVGNLTWEQCRNLNKKMNDRERQGKRRRNHPIPTEAQRRNACQRQEKRRLEKAMHGMFKGEQERMEKIWNDVRQDLRRHLESIQKNDKLNRTWMRELADFFCKFLERVQIARNWHGNYGAERENGVTEDKADYLLFTEKAHNFYLKTTAKKMKVTVVQHEKPKKPEEPEFKSVDQFDQFIEELRGAGGEVSVQDYHGKTAAAKSLPVRDVIRRWQTAKRNGKVLNPPLNMLDMAAKKNSITGLTDMTFLEDVLFEVRNGAHGVGKGDTFGDKHVSTSFRTFSTRWSMSLPHIDTFGVITHVRLEGEGAMKIWIYVGCALNNHRPANILTGSNRSFIACRATKSLG
ncbi:hypothetical protein B0O99DRAFT_261950 [Bisporella sp. PMI_857]|nr:hypothetical protein B0O99DRAFT_261950 [Bisporella sp. PMI_857]